MELQPGQTLKRKYRVVRKIHEGGMGIIYLCADIHSGAFCVVKHPLYQGDGIDVKIEKLKVEASILKTLSHPNIVRYINSFEENNVFYMVIEYINGKDLKTLFNRPVSESQVRNYCGQLLAALEYLHNRNIIHRDIKPRNIMITGNSVKLIDFGGAKMRFTSLQQKGSILYTPGYGAPEQQAGEASFQSDIFGVGATMYFLLTGRDPCTLPPLSPCRENRNASRILNSIVEKATHMDPNMRYQTVKEMRNTLLGVAMPAPLYGPRLIIGSREFRIRKSPLTIGRGSINVLPDIRIVDPEKYISKVHVRIVKDAQGNYWLEDYSINGTFVYMKGTYKKVKRWNLQDNDVFAFCYNSTKGPYMTLKFKN